MSENQLPPMHPPDNRPDIRTRSLADLTADFGAWGQMPFRAKQVWEWLWQKRVKRFEDMTSLSKALRHKLQDAYAFHVLGVAHEFQSGDGSIKYGFRLHDGHLVEGVLIPARDRSTACVSSQVGCSLACKFCATGYMKLQRNLLAHEIFDQVDVIARASEKRLGRSLTNIVYMGMGEPLLNYKNVMASIERITAPDGMGMSPRRITLSTAGVAKMIKKMADDGTKVEFALSLHAANDTKRNTIMPINETNSLEALADALIYFHDKTGTRITLEYIILHDVNDSLEDARELADFARRVPAKINIIEYNPIAEASYRNTTDTRMEAFIGYLESSRFIVNVRRSRGKDVDGGCGQLALKTSTRKGRTEAEPALPS